MGFLPVASSTKRRLLLGVMYSTSVEISRVSALGNLQKRCAPSLATLVSARPIRGAHREVNLYSSVKPGDLRYFPSYLPLGPGLGMGTLS